MNSEKKMDRLPTGIEGLDTVLCGGLIPGSVYIMQGPPGGGKTILANQICFHLGRQGGRSVYFTLLSESHDRLLKHLHSMQFFDSDSVPDFVYYESAFDALKSGGLDGVLRLLNNEGQSRHANLLVLDGLFVIEESVSNETDFRRFINDIAALAHVTDTTILLLTNSKRSPASPEYTMVDGWIELGYAQLEYRVARYLQVHKTRGSDFVSGQHVLTVTDRGVSVLPRLESLKPSPWPKRGKGCLPTGISALDAMLGGGIESGSASLVAGPAGAGKTSAGLHFISQCSKAEPGLIFGFYEDESDLADKAASIGIDLAGMIREGAVEVLWHPPVEMSLDEIGYGLLEAVRRLGARRVLVDGLRAFRQATLYQARVGRCLTALTSRLRSVGVTSMFTLEVQDLVGGELRLQFGPVSAVAENIILLRYRETDFMIDKTLTILKARNASFDTGIRTFEITSEGIRLGASPATTGKSADRDRNDRI